MHPIAIVGIGGVFPGSPTLEQFWDIIESGQDVSREVPPGRWSLNPDDVYQPGPPGPDKAYSKKGYFVDSVEPDYSGLSIDPDLASRLDPMCRLLLAAGGSAFKDFKKNNLDLSRVGLVIGNIALPTEASTALSDEILSRIINDKLPGLAPAASDHNYLPINRYVTGLPAGILAHALNIGGGSYSLDAACASSLFAIKLAADELAGFRADAMLAGGISRPDSLYTQMGFSQLRALSPRGRCSPFDAKADGLVVGEGAGIIVLKRLEDAVAAGDKIHAVIRGIGLSNDMTGNLLAPNSEGQVRAMRQAYSNAGWQPHDLDFIECHGTGTPVGDKAEFESLRQVFNNAPVGANKCILGSVKSNVGHLLTGAGAAGMLKVLLALENKILPATANFETPNPSLHVEDSPFEILKESRPWERRSAETPRRAAVSGFGFGGTNAHVLLEEWIPDNKKAVNETIEVREIIKPCPIAIVGMEASFGPWKNLDAFRDRALGGDLETQPGLDRNWWGAEKTDWFRDVVKDEKRLAGHYINDVDIPIGRFHIPPKEIADMLPQQAHMLKVAADALEDAGYTTDQALSTGVFIGLGLDLNTTNFHFRWRLGDWISEWLKENRPGLGPDQLNDLINRFRDLAGPPLTADRTLGALGSIVASRIAREFHAGGQSHTISSEESSGLRALEVAVRALQNNDLNQALVGSVDFCGDIRVLLTSIPDSDPNENPDWNIPSEGAAALVLKRLDDAKADGSHIYAVIEGLGSANSTGEDAIKIDSVAYMRSYNRALDEAGVELENIGLVEVSGGAGIEEFQAEQSALQLLFNNTPDYNNQVLGCIKSDIGNAGAASGLASIIKAALCLDHKMLAPIRGASSESSFLNDFLLVPKSRHFWIHNNVDGPRRASVSSISVDGNCAHAILSEYVDDAEQGKSEVRLFESEHQRETLFIVQGSGARELLTNLEKLETLTAQFTSDSCKTLAQKWWGDHGYDPEKNKRLGILARSSDELAQLTQKSRTYIDQGIRPSHGEPRIFFEPEPLADIGELAFVFPGSGCHFAGMGRDLSFAWPEIFTRLDRENQLLGSQFAPEQFWYFDKDPSEVTDHKALISAQVAVGNAVKDIMTSLGLKPRAVIGHSLGESASLFATGTWTDRDEMSRRIENSNLFTSLLTGECRAARETWGLSEGEDVDWVQGLVNCGPEQVRAALAGLNRVYLQIINTPKECVIGGDRDAVNQLVKELSCLFVPVHGVTTVHCEVVKAVQKPYHDLHLFETTPPDDIRIYSAAWGKSYTPDTDTAAESITAQALGTMDFPGLINQAYKDGARLFMEMGPGASCTRMIRSILEGRPHLALASYMPGQDCEKTILGSAASAFAHGFDIDLSSLYGQKEIVETLRDEKQAADIKMINIPTGRGEFELPDIPSKPDLKTTQQSFTDRTRPLETPFIVETTAGPMTQHGSLASAQSLEPVVAGFVASQAALTEAHGRYMNLAAQANNTISANLKFQLELIEQLSAGGGDFMVKHTPAAASDVKLFLTREQCLEFATGSIGNVLGPEFSEIDSFPTRVRLPDEPLMLVDRVLEIEGEPLSMTSGRLVTEHDVREGAWYLDNNRMVSGVTIEAGQADLLLSAWLGADFKTRGLSVYRLLDAEVTYFSDLPRPGQTINYDIRIDHFFRNGETYLFRFNFDATINGVPLMSMKNGVAGFFSPTELASGQGLVKADLEKKVAPGKLPDDWLELAAMETCSFNDEQVSSLYDGDLAGCFGDQFSQLELENPPALPTGRLKFIDRVLNLDPGGGRYGLGVIKTEMDIHKGDWFLDCHFVDDKVMPGTLMYECCLHSLRIFLMRMGWVGDASSVTYEPIQGVTSKLKCRGQVIESTKKAAYEIHIKELGYGPEPFAIADGIMYADGKPVVEVEDMTVRLAGLSREALSALWSSQKPRTTTGSGVLFDQNKIIAFATGNPSDAFGEPYKPFDRDRFVARLPAPPYSFIDHIVKVEDAAPFVLKAGGSAVAEYSVHADDWYFKDNQNTMPFAVLMELALQPCGWLAAYLGSAQTSDIDMHFRNLGGAATQFETVTPDSGTLTTTVKMTRVSTSAGTIIQQFDFLVESSKHKVYEGNTYFGFFTKPSLAQQLGINDPELYVPAGNELNNSRAIDYPTGPLYPKGMIQMLDEIPTLIKDGGKHGLGFIRGTKVIDPDDWFFKAHFYQDPVWPGSLGLEAFLQLLKVLAIERWQPGGSTVFESTAAGVEHSWTYRGQVVPENKQVTVEVTAVEADDERRTLTAHGYLSVDGKTIYEMKSFAIRLI